jgi:hypothetical protein
MQAQDVDTDLLADLTAVHTAYQMINGKPVTPVEPAVVYLPTEKFLERFGA